MKYAYAISSVQQPTPTAVLLDMRPVSPDHTIPFQPGQYVSLRVHHNKHASPPLFSTITSSPTEKDHLQCIIQLQDESTQQLHKLAAVGATAEIEGPYGSFTFDQARDTAAVFAAENYGVAPFISMLRYIESQQLTNSIVLFYSCQDQNDIPFFEELVAFEASNPNFHVIFNITQGLTDRLDNHHSTKTPLSADYIGHVIREAYPLYTFFVSGSPQFNEMLKNGLISKDVEPQHIFTESTDKPRPKAKPPVTPFKIISGFALAAGLVMILGIAAFSFLRPSAPVAEEKPQPPQADPPVVQISSDKSEINVGETVTLSWSVTPKNSTCRASGAWEGELHANGQRTITPQDSANYQITCSNNGVEESRATAITVNYIRPSIEFSINKNEVTVGEEATLSWKVTGTSPACKASEGWEGKKEANGSQKVKPTSAVSYTLSCSNRAGEDTKKVSVSVKTPPAPAPTPQPAPAPDPAPSVEPIIVTLRAEPIGRSVKLSWSTVGTSPKCFWTSGLTGDEPPQGSKTVTPSSTTTYAMKCSNSAGTTSPAEITVTVN